jgi:DNA-binding transcriptional regulator PaaX
LPEKIGRIGLAIILCLAERGVVIFQELLAPRGSSLKKSLARIDSLMDVEDYYEYLKNLKENSARTILWRLQKKGLVTKNSSGYLLTQKGDNLIEKINQRAIWDGKWRMVFFDIPESKRKHRLWLGSSLKGNNYSPIQKSVYIGKRPLPDDLAQKMIERDIYKYIRIITIGEIDDEKFLAV